MIQQDLLTDKELLQKQLIESKKILKAQGITEGYLCYLIKDLINYRLNPDEPTKRRIRKNIEIFFGKVDKLK